MFLEQVRRLVFRYRNKPLFGLVFVLSMTAFGPNKEPPIFFYHFDSVPYFHIDNYSIISFRKQGVALMKSCTGC